jgi:hypothetical protein
MYLFILCVKSNSIALKDFIPILLAITVFVANVVYQEFNKKNNIRDKISSEIISTCDKMIRYCVEAEYSALTWKYWNKTWAIHVGAGNEHNIENALSECLYYHRKLEDAGLKLDLLKSELKKSTKDLQKYWHHELQTRLIINLMVKAVLKDPRRFDDQLNATYLSDTELRNDYVALVSTVEREIIFDGIGYDLVRIQKIIDPKSPTLLLSHEAETELIEKIRKDKS